MFIIYKLLIVVWYFSFFFNDTATTEIYTLSLHDALPIFEYDPNRSAYISLIHYADGEKRYILSPLGLKVGDPILSGENAPLKVANALQLKNIPAG